MVDEENNEIQQQDEENLKGGWIYCQKCGKKLMRREPNGKFVFKFGRYSGDGDNVVEIEIFGSAKIKCFREDCRHYNIMNFFPG